MGTKTIVATFAPTPGTGHETVVRIVGTISYNTPSPAAAGVLVVGAAVFADNAVAAGVASLPDPITDVSDDLWTFIQPAPYSFTATPGIRDFDSRGMRKIEEGQQLVYIAANGATGSSVEFAMYFRQLFKTAIRQ